MSKVVVEALRSFLLEGEIKSAKSPLFPVPAALAAQLEARGLVKIRGAVKAEEPKGSAAEGDGKARAAPKAPRKSKTPSQE